MILHTHHKHEVDEVVRVMMAIGGGQIEVTYKIVRVVNEPDASSRIYQYEIQEAQKLNTVLNDAFKTTSINRHEIAGHIEPLVQAIIMKYIEDARQHMAEYPVKNYLSGANLDILRRSTLAAILEEVDKWLK